MKKRPIVLCISNQKGGVGKTTTVCSLAESITGMGFKVGVIDTDPQSNTTSILGRPPYSAAETIISMLNPEFDRPLSTLFVPSPKVDNLYLLPSNIKAASLWPRIYFKLSDFMTNIYSILQQYIEADATISEEFDYIIIDTPPSLDLPMLNALSASDYVIVPVQSGDPFSLDGWAELNSTIEKVKRNINPRLSVLGILITFHDPRYNVCKSNFKYIHNKFEKEGIRVFDNYISASVEVKLSHVTRKPITIFNKSHKVSEQYRALTDEILNIIGGELEQKDEVKKAQETS